jgi:CheY-like chemotaxis protein
MGGEAGYADNPGGGSIFWIEIPVDEGAAAQPGPEAPEASGSDRELPPQHILLVDDIALNRQLIGHFLASGGHTFVEASDGVEAVQKAMETDFDLILMDIRMPRMDGVEATRQIRAMTGRRGLVPIVGVTADNAPSHQEAFRAAGISRHLPKPFSCDDLLRMVDELATERSPLPVAASRAPQRDPVAAGKPLPVLDIEVLEQLISRMSADNIDAYLRTLLGRVNDLLDLLEQPHEEALGDLVHEMQGTAGFLGFAALGAALRALERTDPALVEERERKAAALRTVAEQSREALHQRLLNTAAAMITETAGVQGLRSGS